MQSLLCSGRRHRVPKQAQCSLKRCRVSMRWEHSKAFQHCLPTRGFCVCFSLLEDQLKATSLRPFSFPSGS